MYIFKAQLPVEVRVNQTLLLLMSIYGIVLLFLVAIKILKLLIRV